MGKRVTSLVKKVTSLGETRTEQGALKKHAATIHCSNTLSLLQRKISNALLYHAYHELLTKEEHEITVRDLCRLIGYQGNNHAVIRDAIRELIATVIEWNVIDDNTGAENWTASSIIASVSLEGPLCYYAYSPRMKQLLHSPSMFGKVDLVIQSRFRSGYGLALYENCIRYRGLPYTKWFDMQTFRKLMGVQGGMYDIFRDFKRRVLDKAVDEVNSYSDLIIAPEYAKEGRKISKIRFSLKERAKRIRLGESQPPMLREETKTEIVKQQLMNDFGLKTRQVNQLLKLNALDHLIGKVESIKASLPYRRNKISNKAAYFLAALKEDERREDGEGAVTSEPTRKRAPSRPKGLVAGPSEDLSMFRREVESIRKQYQAYREKEILEAIGRMPHDEHQIFMTQFFLYAEPIIQSVLQLQRSRYSRENILESPQLKALLRHFALRELNMHSLLSLEEFVTTCGEKERIVWNQIKSIDPDHPLLCPQE